jgi:hypothetical protein
MKMPGLNTVGSRTACRRLAAEASAVTRARRLNLREIEGTLAQTKAQWGRIEQDLRDHGIGTRDAAFDDGLMQRMLSAYELLDHFLANDVDIFAPDQLQHLCTLNERVHYGKDSSLCDEYRQAILVNRRKFRTRIPAVYTWYQRQKGSASSGKVASKVFVSILGMPQVFIEGNHRTAALIASWINVRCGRPPFVLSPSNVLDFFYPCSQIKNFSARSDWRGRHQLPKYHKAFKTFWVSQTDSGWRFLD